MHSKNITASKRAFFLGLVISIVVVGVVPFFHRAEAQVAPIPTPTVIVANPPQKLTDAIKKALSTAAALSYKNALRAFLNRAAYDTAVWMASGGKGQKPLFITQPGKLLQQVGDAAAGDFLDSLSTHYIGKSLCEPIDVQSKVKLDIFVRQSLEPSIEGRCSWTNLRNNIEASYNRTTKQQLIDFSYNFNPEANEFGAFIKSRGALETSQIEAKEKEVNKQLFSELTGVFSKIDERLKTPSNLVDTAARVPIEQSFQGYTERTGEPLADAFGIFTNTLVSKLMKRIFEQGFNPEADSSSSSFADIISGRGGGIAAARSVFAKIAQPDFLTGGSIDTVNELTSCPSDPNYNNCIIDSRFGQAVQEGLTLKEAIDRGLIDPNKTFGFDQSGKEPDYQNGYPYRSLVILRKYRVVPVGWELAAQYIRDYADNAFSIKQVMDLYSNCGQDVCSNDNAISCKSDLDCPDDNGDGAPDGQCNVKSQYSPFCGLVDPNWVLKAPEASCRRQGAGESVISQEWVDHDGDTQAARQKLIEESEITPNERQVIRREECVDEQTCITESADGSCQRFGYCTQEKDVWRFRGESCDAQYASCRTFTDTQGAQASYLQNTLDYNSCSASNAGCQWYCSEQNPVNSQWQCDFGLSSTGQQNRLAFDRDAATCDASAQGCNEYIRTKTGLGTNLVRNPSFERFNRDVITDARIDDNGDDKADLAQYDINNTENNLDITRDAYQGQFAMKLIGVPGAPSTWYAPHSTDTGRPLAGRTFTGSFYAKLLSCTDGSTSKDSSVQLVGYAPDVWAKDQPVTYQQGAWQRYTLTGTFAKNLDPHYVSLQMNLRAIPGCTVVYDALQLEEGGSATEWKDYGATNKIFLNGKRASCAFDDVGCELYTPLTSGVPVTGKVTDPSSCDQNDPSSCDQCPAAFVGCKAFREMAIDHTPTRQAREPVSFVPSTGKTCPATMVGCEEYTNLDEVARGGEGREYYSFIRQCVKPADAGANAQSYYTWVGSDEFGYQLREFNLLKSNASNAPCTNLGPDAPFAGGQRYPNCVDGIPFDDNNDGTAEPHPVASCTADDLLTNPDCTEFYNSTGQVTYRLRSRIIFVSDECHPFRNTVDSNEGRDVTYHMVPGEGLSCAAEYAGCREYKGSAGQNVRTLLSSTFEDGTIAPWTSNASPELNPSNNATQAGGHSMVVFDITAGGATAVVGPSLEQKRSYVLSFWAAGGANDVSIESGLYDGTGALIAKFTGTAIARAGTWNQYSLGPLFLDQFTSDPNAVLFIGGTNAFYLDNIVFQEVVDDLFVIKDSYTECSGYENCAAYSDRDGRTNFLKSFSKICDAGAVGCEALIETYNSDNPFSENVQVTSRKRGDWNTDGSVNYKDRDLLKNYFSGTCTTGLNKATPCTPNDSLEDPGICGAGERCQPGVVRTDPWAIMDVDGNGSVTTADRQYLINYISGGPAPVPYPMSITIPGDTTVAVVNNRENYCQSSVAGCTALGKPFLNADNIVEGYETAYVINDPDTYSTALCRQEESGCQEYNSDAGFAYFKSPGTRTCVYSTPAGGTPGWYVNGTDVGCGPQQTVSSIAEGMTGLCPAAQSGCTEYRDPLDPKGCDVNVPANYRNVGRCVGGASAGTFCDTTAFCTAGPNNGQECDVVNPGGTCGINPATSTAYPCVLANATQCSGGSCQAVASCNAHYYIESTVDKQSCNGVVDDLGGCRLFFNSNVPPPTFYAKGTTDGSVPSGACDNNAGTPLVPDCDANEVVKVQRDRVCSTWLECSTGTKIVNAKGEKEEACFARTPCNKLDPVTGKCVGFRACSDSGIPCTRDADCINGICTPLDPKTPESVCQKKSTVRCTAPSDCLIGGDDFGPCVSLPGPDLNFTSSDNQDINNVNLLSNMSGLVKPGLSWGVTLRCRNNPDKECTAASAATDCSDGICDLLVDRNIPGDKPYSIMEEQGMAGTSNQDLIKDGDFWDSNFLESTSVKPDDDSTLVTTGKSFRGWETVGTTTIVRLTERGDDGSIPGNPKLNENNILEVKPGSVIGDGATYNLGVSALSGVDYVLSFKAAYEQGNAQPGDALTFKLVHYNASGVKVGETVFGVYTPTTAWEEFIFDPKTVSTASVSSTKLSITQNTASGRAVYLDDVSMRPVLKVKDGADNKIVRTCRMYPRTDSPLCEYVDHDGVTFRGWRGYCIEKDPKNPNICINWWPVDIITGETSVFGQEGLAGYNGRTPLYYCLNGKGNSEPLISVSNVFWCDTASCSTSTYSPPITSSSNTYKITFGVANGSWVIVPLVNSGGWNNCQGSWDWDGHCDCAAAGCSSPTIADGYMYTAEIDTEIKETDIDSVRTNWLKWDSGDPWPQLTFTRSRVEGNVDEDVGHQLSAAPPSKYRFTKIEQQIDGTNYIIWRAFPLFSCEGAIGENCLWLDLVFLKDTKQLKYIRTIGEDATGTRSEDGIFNLDFYLREPCLGIVKVVKEGGETSSWADRISAGSSYKILGGDPSYTQYSYQQDLAPFGSIPSLTGTPEQWYGKERNSPLYIQAPYLDSKARGSQTRAGSPYACGEFGEVIPEGCGQAMCLGGDSNGKPCDTPEHQKNCEDGDGVCGGIYPPVTVPARPVGTAVYQIRYLFANAFEAWSWDDVTQHYVPDTNGTVTSLKNWQDQFRDMSICSAAGRSFANDFCAVRPTVGNLTLSINGVDYRNDQAPRGGWIIPADKGATVTMKFTANVDKEEVPLDTILVDWDGTNSSDDRQGSMSWGYAPRSDSANPFIFFYALAKSGTFRPTVKLIDHWNACSNVQLKICNGGTLDGWRLQSKDDEQRCTTAGGAVNVPNPLAVVNTKAASCGPNPADNPGWYAFNGTITVP